MDGNRCAHHRRSKSRSRERRRCAMNNLSRSLKSFALKGHDFSMMGTAFCMKGTGFSPYINCQKRSRALAPEGLRISKTIFAIAFFAALIAPTTLPPQQEKPWEKIPLPKLHDFKPQQPKRIELKNGIVLFLQEDHELPFVSGAVLIPGGSRDEAACKTGPVEAYGQAWRTSGAEKMSGDAMDDFLEARAA